MIHRQGSPDALLHRCDPGRLQAATSVQAKDDPRLTESKPKLPLLLVDIDGVISLFAFEGGPPAGGLVPLDRWHTPLPFCQGGRAPARAHGLLRVGVGQRLGGEGQRIPAPPAWAAEAAPLELRRQGRAHQCPLEARLDRSLCGREAFGLDRRRFQRGLPRVGRRPLQPDPACSDDAGKASRSGRRRLWSGGHRGLCGGRPAKDTAPGRVSVSDTDAGCAPPPGLTARRAIAGDGSVRWRPAATTALGVGDGLREGALGHRFALATDRARLNLDGGACERRSVEQAQAPNQQRGGRAGCVGGQQLQGRPRRRSGELGGGVATPGSSP